MRAGQALASAPVPRKFSDWLERESPKAKGFPKLNRPRLSSALRSVPASSDARRFAFAAGGSRLSRMLIAHVDGPNEGPAKMVITGGYR
jgi:hypothetical protein